MSWRVELKGHEEVMATTAKRHVELCSVAQSWFYVGNMSGYAGLML